MNSPKILLYFLIGFYCCYSCKNQTSSAKLEFYKMPSRVSNNRHNAKFYYYPYNFIIDTASKIYFFQQEPPPYRCSYINWWEKIAIPKNINLEPKDLIEIPSDNIDEFVKVNIIKSQEEKRYVFIASPFDSISSIGLSKIMTIFKDTANHVHFRFRKTTQEENIVLKYKKMPYEYFNNYYEKWDSTKTLFHNVIYDVEMEQATNSLNISDQYYKKMISKETYNKLMLETTDSACLEKVAKRLKVNVDYLFDFEL